MSDGITDMNRDEDYDNYPLSDLTKEIKKLKLENENLNSKIIDLLFEANYNKQIELIEFLRNIYESLEMKEIKRISKKELLMNLKHSIEEFAKNNKINL